MVDFGGWAFNINLEDLLNEVKHVHANTQNWKHLGTTTAQQDERMADIVNRAIEEFMEAHPALNKTTENITMTASTRTTAIPTTLHGAAIEKLTYSDTDASPINDLDELQFVQPSAVARMPLGLRNGYTTDLYPSMWSYDKDMTNIMWYPLPSTTRTIVCHFRAEHTAITEANVTTPAAVTIGVLPTRFQNVLALGIALKMMKRTDAALAAVLRQEYEQELRRSQRRIARHQAQWKNERHPFPPIVGKMKGAFPGSHRGRGSRRPGCK